MKDLETIKGVGGAIILFVVLFMLMCCTGCKILQSKKVNLEDTASVKKEVTELAKVDTSKSKSESAYTKETFIYGRDTTITNFIFQPSQPAVYIKESGSKKEETNTFQFESFRQEILDSLRASKKEVQVETKAKVGLDLITIILLCAVGLLLIKNFLPFKIIKT